MKSIFKFLPVVAAGLSTAFLIPTTVSDDVAHEIEAKYEAIAAKVASYGASLAKSHRTVELDCPNCPFYEGEVAGGYRVWTKERNALLFDIATDFRKPMTLTINGMDIIHPSHGSVLTAKQVPKDSSHLTLLNRLADPKVKLNYEIFMSPVSLKIRKFRIHIMSVDNFRTARDMNIIEVLVGKDNAGFLHIVKLDVRPPSAAESSVAECKQNIICRWKAYFADTVSKGFGTKKPGCHGKNPAITGGRHPAVETDKFERPHDHHDMNSGHWHGRNHHRISHAISVFVTYVLLPIPLGIAAGILVSIIGMFVSHLVIMSYRWATGKPYAFLPRCEGCMQGASEENTGLLSEKLYVIVEDEEELPAYTDSEGVLRGDEKEQV